VQIEAVAARSDYAKALAAWRASRSSADLLRGKAAAK